MRLVTRSDFDGLACTALLLELGIVDSVLNAHPKDIQDGKIPIDKNDVLANVPFQDACGLWFDHHSSEHERNNLAGRYQGASDAQASCARVIYNYYFKNPQYRPLLEKFEEMLAAVDIADAGKYKLPDILHPRGWMLLAFLADPRTGLGLHRHFRISNLDLMKKLPNYLRTMTIDEILALPDFAERISYYYQSVVMYRDFIKDHSFTYNNLIIIDLRAVKSIPLGNRFIEYTVYPEQNISIRLADGKNNEFVMIAVGYSTINRTARLDIGSLMLSYGGGGHKKVGTCHVPAAQAEQILSEIIDKLST